MSRRAFGKLLFLLLILALMIYDILTFANAFNFHHAVFVIILLQFGWWSFIIVTILLIILLAALIKQDHSLF